MSETEDEGVVKIDTSRFIDDQAVHMVAKTSLDQESLKRYLHSVDAYNYAQDVEDRQLYEALSQGAELVMAGGKLCYRSWEPELNPNVTRVRDNPSEYLGNIVGSGHGSVLEHVNYSFIFGDVSRVFTHELVRHRHEAISQESMRYVRLEELRVWFPECLEPIKAEAAELLEAMENFQIVAAEKLGFNDEESPMPFSEKKILTSAMRRFAPIGISTSMLWTANLRSLRHIIEMRTSPGAEVEIRNVFRKVGHIMKEQEPEIFADFELAVTAEDPDGAWVSAYSKV